MASGRIASVASTARPTTTTLRDVPIPGFWRSGIQASSTSAPMMFTIMPNDSPVFSERPWWKTSQGSRPSEARICSARLAPYRTRPA